MAHLFEIQVKLQKLILLMQVDYLRGSFSFSVDNQIMHMYLGSNSCLSCHFLFN